MKKRTLIIGFAISLFSCTENQRTRNFGGTETINLPENCKFLSATWKKDNLWICYKDTTTNINYLKEVSSWGLLEGTVVIKDLSKTKEEPTWGIVK